MQDLTGSVVQSLLYCDSLHNVPIVFSGDRSGLQMGPFSSWNLLSLSCCNMYIMWFGILYIRAKRVSPFLFLL